MIALRRFLFLFQKYRIIRKRYIKYRIITLLQLMEEADSAYYTSKRRIIFDKSKVDALNIKQT